MSFKSDVLRLASGTAVAQLVTLAVAPLLARLFTPEAFGSAAIFASAIGVSSVLACLSYEQAIVLPPEDREAANLLGLCVALALASAAVMALGLWVGRHLFAGWWETSEFSAYLWLLPVATLLQGAFGAMNYWNTRTRHFGRLSASQIAGQLTASSLNVTGGLSGYTTGGTMIVASIAGQAVSVGTLGSRIWRDHGALLRASIGLRSMLAEFVRHRKFPLYTTWSALLNAVSWQLPVIMLGAFFAPAIVGFYALGFRVLQLPMNLVGRSISQVFLQRAAVEQVQGDLGALVKTLFQKLVIAAALPCLVLSIVGRDLFTFVFGSNWAEAGVYVQLLAPWALVWFVSSPLSSLYYVVGKQREEMLIQGAIFVSRLIAIGIAGYVGNARLAVLLFALSGILTYGYLVKVLFGFVHLRALPALRECFAPLRDALLCAVPLLALRIWGVPSLVLFGVSAILMCAFGFRHRALLRTS